MCAVRAPATPPHPWPSESAAAAASNTLIIAGGGGPGQQLLGSAVKRSSPLRAGPLTHSSRAPSCARLVVLAAEEEAEGPGPGRGPSKNPTTPCTLMSQDPETLKP